MAAACPSAEQNVLDRLKRRGSRDPFKCSVVVKKVSISGAFLSRTPCFVEYVCGTAVK